MSTESTSPGSLSGGAQARDGEGSSVQTGVGTNGGGEDPQAMVADLQKQLADMQRLLSMVNLQPAAATPPVINVTAQAAVRIKPFSGFVPQPGEVTFTEWEQQCQQLLQDGTIPDLRAKMLGSLRGLAYQQAKDCGSAADILETLRSIYGEVKTVDDMLLEFNTMALQPKEAPSVFLGRLWSALSEVAAKVEMGEPEQRRRVYHVFSRSVPPMLALELRNTFGFPGEATPDLTKLLQTVRRVEGTSGEPNSRTRDSSRVHASAAGVSTGLSEGDLDKIAEKVAEKLRPAFPGPPGPVPPGSHPPQFRGRCYRCGGPGHFARQCRNTQDLNANQSASGARR